MHKILLVEDDDGLSRMYQRMLSIDGYTVERAADGEQGFELAKTFQPDLILLDMMMPKMNGFQTLDILKAEPTTAKIPIFILSNVAGVSEAELAVQKGADKYLNKSVYEPEQILDIISSHFYSHP